MTCSEIDKEIVAIYTDQNMSTSAKNVIIWTLTSLLALTFLGAGLSKIIGMDTQIERLNIWGYPLWLRYPIGGIELLMGISMLFPNYWRFAFYDISTWAVVAVLTHLQAGQTVDVVLPLAIGALAGVWAWLVRIWQRDYYLSQLIKRR